MASVNTSGRMSFQNGATPIPSFTRVAVDAAGKLELAADDATKEIGVTTEIPIEANAMGGVTLKNFPGTRKLVAVDAVPAFAPVFRAADGKVSVAGESLLGLSNEPVASAAGQVIEVIPLV